VSIFPGTNIIADNTVIGHMLSALINKYKNKKYEDEHKKKHRNRKTN